MLRILVIDDQKSVRDMIGKALKSKGFLVITAKNGKEGVKLSLKEQPDLIMADLQMPVMDGLKTIKKIRESGDWGMHAKVVILTNFPPDNLIINKMAFVNPLYYMIKTDWSLEEITAKVIEIVGNPNAGE